MARKRESEQEPTPPTVRGAADSTSSNPPSGAGELPPSATHFGFNCVAALVVLATVFVLRRLPESWVVLGRWHLRRGNQDDAIALMLAAALPVIFFELVVLKVHRRPSTGIDWDREWSLNPTSIARVATKLLGLALTLGIIALCWWTWIEYHGTFYDPLYNLLYHFRYPLVVIAVSYITIVDGVMIEHRVDGGALLLPAVLQPLREAVRALWRRVLR
jgi:hypothetical protein